MFTENHSNAFVLLFHSYPSKCGYTLDNCQLVPGPSTIQLPLHAFSRAVCPKLFRPGPPQYQDPESPEIVQKYKCAQGKNGCIEAKNTHIYENKNTLLLNQL